MESTLLQRLVGAAVLVALGVIFIPALLDGAGYKARQRRDIHVEPKPAFPPPGQTRVAPIATPLSRMVVKQADGNITPAKHIEKPVQAFALQVGTFSQRGNAEGLRDKLRKAGYACFVVPVVDKGKTSYKVRIGPELEKSRLDKIKPKIKKAFKLDSYVVNHP